MERERDTTLRIVYLNLYAFWIVILGKWDSLTSTVVESSLRITVADENSFQTLDYKLKLYIQKLSICIILWNKVEGK